MKTLNLRLPDDLHAAIVQAAKEEDRSLNSQIINALRYFLDMRLRTHPHNEQESENNLRDE